MKFTVAIHSPVMRLLLGLLKPPARKALGFARWSPLRPAVQVRGAQVRVGKLLIINPGKIDQFCRHQYMAKASVITGSLISLQFMLFLACINADVNIY